MKKPADKHAAALESLKLLGARRPTPPEPSAAAVTALTQNPTSVATVARKQVRHPRRTFRFKPEDEALFAAFRKFLFANDRPAENETLVVRAALRLAPLDDRFLAVVDELEAADSRRAQSQAVPPV